MDSILYMRIKELCKKTDITIAELERTLGFGNSSIKKWENTSSPSVDKIDKIAEYFNVSIDYLLGRSDIESPISELIGDEDIILFQQARQKMTSHSKKNEGQSLILCKPQVRLQNEDII